MDMLFECFDNDGSNVYGIEDLSDNIDKVMSMKIGERLDLSDKHGKNVIVRIQ